MPRPEAPRSGERPFVAGGAMLHPVCLLALGTWWLNDAVLKARYHNWLTGKLSDLACMVVFPVLVLCVVQVLGSLGNARWQPRREHVLSTVFGVGLLFAGINLSENVGEVYKQVFAWVLYPFLLVLEGSGRMPIISHTQDASDLMTLPALYLAYRLAPCRAAPGVDATAS
jgi:hypothetical protein